MSKAMAKKEREGSKDGGSGKPKREQLNLSVDGELKSELKAVSDLDGRQSASALAEYLLKVALPIHRENVEHNLAALKEALKGNT